MDETPCNRYKNNNMIQSILEFTKEKHRNKTKSIFFRNIKRTAFTLCANFYCTVRVCESMEKDNDRIRYRSCNNKGHNSKKLDKTSNPHCGKGRRPHYCVGVNTFTTSEVNLLETFDWIRLAERLNRMSQTGKSDNFIAFRAGSYGNL